MADRAAVANVIPISRRGTPGRGGHLSRGSIAWAGVRVADGGGARAVTMRSVAAELGVTAASLYRHVDDREDLLDAMTDEVCAEIVYAEAGPDPVADVVAIGLQQLAIHRRHAWLNELGRMPVVGPNGLGATERVLELLRDHPASDDAKLTAYAIMNALVASFARFQAAPTDPDRQRRQQALIAHQVAAGALPHLAALQVSGPGDPETAFPDVLDRVVRALLEPAT